MNLNRFLSSKDTNLASIVANADKNIQLNADDLLFAVGSLVEGLGSSKSDLDLLLITPRDESTLPQQDHVTWVDGRCLVDMRILRRDDADKLLGRFKHWCEQSWNVTHATKFSIDDRTLLHRLHYGRSLIHKKHDKTVPLQTPTQTDLSRLKLHIARQASRTIQVDMVGHKDGSDYGSLVFAAQEILGHAIDALLAGHLITNPLLKWRWRLLSSLPTNWTHALTEQSTELTAAQHVWHLYQIPEHLNKKSCLLHAFRITTFARAVFNWAERQLMTERYHQQTPIRWYTQSHPRDNGHPLPYLNFDVDFFLANDHVTVSRLNEFANPLILTQQEFALFLLFDGNTHAHDAITAVYGIENHEENTSILDNLITRIAQANLCVLPEELI